MVLEDSLPPELTQYDLNLPAILEYDMGNNEDNATCFDTSTKGYILNILFLGIKLCD